MVTLDLPPELERALRDLAKERDQPEADIIREALASFVLQHQQSLPSSWGSGENRDLHAADADAWLHRHAVVPFQHQRGAA